MYGFTVYVIHICVTIFDDHFRIFECATFPDFCICWHICIKYRQHGISKSLRRKIFWWNLKSLRRKIFFEQMQKISDCFEIYGAVYYDPKLALTRFRGSDIEIKNRSRFFVQKILREQIRLWTLSAICRAPLRLVLLTRLTFAFWETTHWLCPVKWCSGTVASII